MDTTTIGVAKPRLTGSHEEPGPAKGESVGLFADRGDRSGDRIGAVVRTRDRVKPVYVSVGHRVGLRSAIALTLACTGRYRLPEPVRLADALSKRRRPT